MVETFPTGNFFDRISPLFCINCYCVIKHNGRHDRDLVEHVQLMQVKVTPNRASPNPTILNFLAFPSTSAAGAEIGNPEEW